MELIHRLPKEDGFYMPAEFAPHEATILIWPTRAGSWGTNPAQAQEAFSRIIGIIAQSENVCLLVDESNKEAARKALMQMTARNAQQGMGRASYETAGNISLLPISSDDAWARDTAPTFLTDGKEVRGVNWEFNAWGGEVDGLYASWEKDNALACEVCRQLRVPCYDADGFVLEGGSVHSDGEGTVLTTESCLLSKGRNPKLTKPQIEERLKGYLGAGKILWLPGGIYQDETNGHVDNVCAFTAPGEAVLAWTDNPEDPQYALSMSCLDYLENQTDARGRRIRVHKLPIPDVPVCVKEEDVGRYSFEEGEEKRKVGERLAASYVNFYFTNDSVIVPQFGGENRKSDRRALEILGALCPGRRVIGVDSRIILLGGGNIHCITQQIPKAV